MRRADIKESPIFVKAYDYTKWLAVTLKLNSQWEETLVETWLERRTL